MHSAIYPIYNVRNVRVKPCYQLKQLLLIRITEKIHYKLIPFDYLNFQTYDICLNAVRIRATVLISPQTNLEENFKIVLEPGKRTLALYPLYEQPCVHINIIYSIERASSCCNDSCIGLLLDIRHQRGPGSLTVQLAQVSSPSPGHAEHSRPVGRSPARRAVSGSGRAWTVYWEHAWTLDIQCKND